MDENDIPEVFWEALGQLSFDDLPPGPDPLGWRPALPTGLTDVLEVAPSDLSYGRMVHLVGDPASLERLRDKTLEAFGRIDIMVCAAGTTKRVPTLEMDEADWARIIETALPG